MRKIILCADDYGYNRAVSSGILDLLEKKRLSATNCITNFPFWSKTAVALRDFHGLVDIGLHFNLTEGLALNDGRPQVSLLNLIKKAYFKQLDLNTITKELELQLTKFIEKLGFLPDFIDGHQHIQQLPIIREAIFTIYMQYFPNKTAYIRCSSNGFYPSLKNFYNFPKTFLIHLLGAAKLKAKLLQLQIPYNQAFSGIYNFSHATHYRDYFQRFVREINPHGLIMCHPALKSECYHDTMSYCRSLEYGYFASDRFTEDRENLNFSLSRFCEI